MASSESKLIKRLRAVLGFVLSAVIAALSVAICANAVFLNEKNIEKRFTCYEYVSAVRNDVIEYTKSVYDRNGLDKSNIDSIITFEAVDEVAENYAGHYISFRVSYDESSYLASIKTVGDEIADDIAVQVTNSNQQFNQETASEIVSSINDYFDDAVSLTGVSYLETVLNIGTPVCYIIIGVCLFFFVFITLILFFLGEKRYRSLRTISISFLTSGIFEMCLAFIVFVISRVKTIDVYPLYLSQQLMKYIDECIIVVVISGAAAVMVSVAVSAVTWVNKIKGKR